MRGGNLVNVYNFALARVHYQAAMQPANDVRVFFRLFAANSTATDFHSDTTYSRDPAAYPVPPANFGQHTTPTPGVIANEYVSVPCFATTRQDPTQAGAPNSLPQQQLDTPNDRNLPATGGPIKIFTTVASSILTATANPRPTRCRKGGGWSNGQCQWAVAAEQRGDVGTAASRLHS